MVLLTGAAGFIGSHTAGALLRKGCSVVGVDSFDAFYDPQIKRANLREMLEEAGPAGADRFTLVEADITDSDAIARTMARYSPTSVIHLAARAGVRPSIAQPALYARVNVEGTSVMLEAARANGVRRFVMASSSSVYGNNPKVPFAETDDVSHPISPYAATKRACEMVGHTFHSLYRLPVACLRFFTVFGPRQRPDLAISLFMRRIAEGQPIPVFGDGSARRDFTFIGDIVAGILAAHDRIPEHGFRVWNLGNSHPISVAEMIDAIERTLGRRALIDRKPAQPGDVERTFADLARSSAELGYRPQTSFEEGLTQQWTWMQRRLGASASQPVPAAAR